MPSTRHTIIVSARDRKRLVSPTWRMKPAKVLAAPVNVSTPITTPTIAHARPTGRACLAPSIRPARMIGRVVWPPRTKKLMTTSAAIAAMTGVIPQRVKLEAPRPRAIQKISGTPADRIEAEMLAPRISSAVKARPVIPANIGVKPLNSMNTSPASGTRRCHCRRMASHAFGHWSFGMPMSCARPASRCTIQNAVT